ncbi:MAG: class I SAM-dependent methyltransferase [Ferruginibacter sp.]
MASNRSFFTHIQGFNKKLSQIDASQLSCDPYAKRYLQHLLLHSKYYLSIYVHVLDHALENTNVTPNNLVLLDYGAGNGLLGIFAKYVGFGKVYLCDTDPAFVKAANELAQKLQEDISGFITGELKHVVEQYPTIVFDVVVGTDVIEHIYDLDVFFAGLQKINPRLLSVFTTASNPDNPIKTAALKKLQIKDETEGGDPADFALAGAEKHEAFLQIRKAIILTTFPTLDQNSVLKLAAATRGLYQPAIIASVKNYIDNGQLPVLPDGSNTCHPLTGSWTERILPISSYEKIYALAIFELKIYNGFYNEYAPGLKKYLNRLLNLGIKILGRRMAPFITLKGLPGHG